MVIEDKPRLEPPIEWTPCDLFVLALLGEQRAISLDHLHQFMRLFERTLSTTQPESLKSTVHNLVERLQRAGLVTMQQVEGSDSCWVWLTKGGMRHLGMVSSWKQPTRRMLPTLHAANAVRLLLAEQYPQSCWMSRQQLRLETSSHELSSLSSMPVAECETGEGDCLAVHVVLRLAGTEEQIIARMEEQLQRKTCSGKPYYTALWYYATSHAASRLRAARAKITTEKMDTLAQKIRIFSYPLVHKVVLYRGHLAAVSHIAWSPDGEWIASTGADQTLQVWSARSGTLLSQHHLLTAPFSALAWSADSMHLALVDQESTLYIWEKTTGEMRSMGTIHADLVTGLAWSPDHSALLASCSLDGSLQVLDLARNKPVWTVEQGHEHGVCTLAWSPHGTYLATGGNDARVRIFDASTGQHVLTYKKHDLFLSTLAWSPDSTRIASASDDLDVQIWDASSGKKMRTLWSDAGMVHTLAWSPDGTRLAWTGDEERVEVWEVRTGKRIQVYDDHAALINSLAWSPDSSLLASGSDDGTVHVYRATGGHP